MQSFVNANVKDFPGHANVVFVGDSSDALMGLTFESQNGKLTSEAYIKALSILFLRADTESKALGGTSAWAGKSFLHGYRDLAAKRGQFMGLSLYTINNFEPSLEKSFSKNPDVHYQESISKFWKAWPVVEP